MGGTTVIKEAKHESTSRHSARSAEIAGRSPAAPSPADSIFFLQRTIGNRAMQRLFKAGQLQPKLKIGAPNDVYEQEADRVADQVMSMPEAPVFSRERSERGRESGSVQRKPGCPHGGCSGEVDEDALQAKPLVGQITPFVQRQVEETSEEEDEPHHPGYDMEEHRHEAKPQESFPILDSVPTRDAGELADENDQIQPKTYAHVSSRVTPSIFRDISSIKGGGRPLSTSERVFFEPRFKADFSPVRVHTDSTAVHIARSINARAFTLGSNVVFGVDQYSPGTNSGRRLLARELAHVKHHDGGKDAGAGIKTGIAGWHGNLIQRNKAKKNPKKPLYLWSLRKIPLTEALIRRTATYRYLRRFQKASDTEARIACQLWHNDLSPASQVQRWKTRHTAASRAKLYLSLARELVKGANEVNKTDELKEKYAKHLARAYEIMRVSRGSMKQHIERFCKRVDRRYFECYRDRLIAVTKTGGNRVVKKIATAYYVELKNKKSHTPAEALRLLFKHMNRWSLECAMAVQIANLYAKLQTFGASWFNRNMKIQLIIGKNLITGKETVKVENRLVIAQNTSSSMQRKLVYRRDAKDKPLVRTFGESRRFAKEIYRDKELLDEAPVGSRIVFTTDESDVQNATKVGHDKYEIFGLRKTTTSYSRSEVELAMAHRALTRDERRTCGNLPLYYINIKQFALRCPSIVDKRKKVFIASIIIYDLF